MGEVDTRLGVLLSEDKIIVRTGVDASLMRGSLFGHIG